MSGFPKLIPAFTAEVPITAPTSIGSTRSGGLVHAGFVPEAGSLKSEPGYPIQVDAVFLHGSDYIRPDPDQRHVRLEVSSLMRDAKSGAHFRFDYRGTGSTTGPAGLVLSGSPEAKTTEFGEVFTQVSFECDNEALKAMSEKVYVGSGRFILQEGKPVIVEYKISEVAA
ncbi:hypothetical protein MCOR27_001616 [Pyricularia oryzae]|uniref:Uncharacterized protein n=4 Tax=Pyricularia TaxID=48558 RepID=A0ABQ8NKU4_PYRGI|nr:hypothetical protein OOU_Y34scaffold00648g5 [Pyricularia oryzae Y34]KAH8841905.1 hypothetical protein MCOR01_005854 [Pyricularia oryzae]KAI6298566.1 hypothetical protein MCOR33_005353 [Pyricularia grisea]KAI6255265.1 hypothetical protein MCOR19_008239 [Pyricularia oryzae]KAI6280568.1 hypothetical protein MCOR26_003642 [Pyricularia oryzae]